MKPEPERNCPLCGSMAECRKVGGEALFFACTNRDCGPAEISADAVRSLDRTRTVLHMMLSKEAQKARRDGSVLRVTVEPGTRELHRETFRTDE